MFAWQIQGLKFNSQQQTFPQPPAKKVTVLWPPTSMNFLYIYFFVSYFHSSYFALNELGLFLFVQYFLIILFLKTPSSSFQSSLKSLLSCEEGSTTSPGSVTFPSVSLHLYPHPLYVYHTSWKSCKKKLYIYLLICFQCQAQFLLASP